MLHVYKNAVYVNRKCLKHPQSLNLQNYNRDLELGYGKKFTSSSVRVQRTLFNRTLFPAVLFFYTKLQEKSQETHT